MTEIHSKSLGGCLLGCGFILVVLLASIVVEALIIRLGWNFVLANQLKVTAVHMTFKAAFVSALVLNLIGGMFRTTVSKS